MRNTPLYLMAVILFVSSDHFVLAAGNKPRASAQALKIVKQYSKSSLPTDTDVLPAAYVGNDCRQLSSALAIYVPPKDEFETSEKYKDRIAGASGIRLTGELTLSDTVGFVPEASQLTSKYNADTGELKVSSFPIALRALVGNSSMPAIIVDSKLTSRDSYAATNAYGKMVKVERTRFDVCAVGLAKANDLGPGPEITITIALSPEEAKSARDSIGIAIVGQLRAPYFAPYFNGIKPTVDYPNEVYWKGYSLIIGNAQAWFYNKTTGQVYKKVDL